MPTIASVTVTSDPPTESCRPTRSTAQLLGERLALRNRVGVDRDLRSERELDGRRAVLRLTDRDPDALDVGDSGLDLLDELGRRGRSRIDRGEVDERLDDALVAADVLRAVEFVSEHVDTTTASISVAISCASSIVVPGGNSALTDMPTESLPAGKMLNPRPPAVAIPAPMANTATNDRPTPTARPDHPLPDGYAARRPMARAAALLGAHDRIALAAAAQDEPAPDRRDEHDREQERHEQRDDHRRGDRSDELPENPTDEEHRREHDDRGQRPCERGAAHAVDRTLDDTERIVVSASRFASIDSEITIASSTSSPSVRISPNSVIVFSVNPIANRPINAPEHHEAHEPRRDDGDTPADEQEADEGDGDQPGEQIARERRELAIDAGGEVGRDDGRISVRERVRGELGVDEFAEFEHVLVGPVGTDQPDRDGLLVAAGLEGDPGVAGDARFVARFGDQIADLGDLDLGGVLERGGQRPASRWRSAGVASAGPTTETSTSNWLTNFAALMAR